MGVCSCLVLKKQSSRFSTVRTGKTSSDSSWAFEVEIAAYPGVLLQIDGS